MSLRFLANSRAKSPSQRAENWLELCTVADYPFSAFCCLFFSKEARFFADSAPDYCSSVHCLVVQDSVGQQVFCEELQQSNQANVPESVFLRLVECFTYVLKESHEAEDYLSARLLMNICFTIFYETADKKKVFLYEAVRTQPIWQSLRFWNAAFYDALRYERAKRPPRV